jgi:hypothetical protein
MRLAHTAFLLAIGASPALAQTGPVIVIPGRPDVPVIENGVDISWAVVESELGLARPGVLTPTVIYRPPPPVIISYAPASPQPGFFPSSGKTPGYGRLERAPDPNQPPPKPAQSFRQSWSAHSANTPADLPSNNQYPMYISPFISPSVNGPANNNNPWGNAPVPGQPNGRPGMPGAGSPSVNEVPNSGWMGNAPVPGQPNSRPGMPGAGNPPFSGMPNMPAAGPMPGRGPGGR